MRAEDTRRGGRHMMRERETEPIMVDRWPLWERLSDASRLVLLRLLARMDRSLAA